MDEQFHADHPRLQVLAEDAELLAEAIVETVSESFLLLDSDLRVRFANRSFYITFRLMPQETLERPVFKVGNGQLDLPALRRLLEEVLPSNNSFQNFEVTHEFPAVGRKVMNLNARKLRRRTDQRELILLAIADITVRKQIEAQQAQRERTVQQELTRTKEDLQALTHRLLTAEDQEHRRIASELHDDFIQRLAVLEMDIEQLRQQLPVQAAPLEGPLKHLQESTSVLSEDLRRLSHKLHPSTLDNLGLKTALKRLVKDFAQNWPQPVDYICQQLPDQIPCATALALYRITQEALHNVSKHARGASVAVRLTGMRQGLCLEIGDTGPGFVAEQLRGQNSLGIISMEERARLVGADLQVQTRSGEGTRILVSVPLSPAPSQGVETPSD